MLESPNLAQEAIKNDQEVKKGIIERLTKKYPQLRGAVLALVSTLATFGSVESYVEEDIPPAEPIAQQSFDEIVGKIGDPKVTEQFRLFKDDFINAQKTMPIDPLFSSGYFTVSVNQDSHYNHETVGTLPESSQDIVVAHHNKVRQMQSENGDKTNMIDSLASTFYIVPAGSVQEQGESFEMKGRGAKPSEAIQNALESAVDFMGVTIHAETGLKEHSIISTTAGNESSSTIDEQTGCSARHAIKGYQVTNINKSETGGPIEVTISVKPGVVVEQAQSINYLEK